MFSYLNMSLQIRSTKDDDTNDDWSFWSTGTTKKEEEPEVPRICQKTIKEMCKKHDLYMTPELNEKLYLHYGGFRKIENLDAYTELRALWLQGNIISKIENISNLKKLRCLFELFIFNCIY